MIFFLLLFVLGGLVKRLQPDVAESDVRVGVVAGLGLFQNSLEFFLTRAPFHLGQVKVADQRPTVWMFIANLEPME